MSRWWECKTCGANLGEYGAEVMAHREGTGHVGAMLILEDCPRPSQSSAEVRAEALAMTRDAVRGAKVKGDRV